ncbi:MAG: anhydro-N-acetylmuramic acid kinase [Planctomycetota bacterium]|nr:anhydro-N-acetylmuramic acid kinase [Planctomycetota bacterium]
MAQASAHLSGLSPSDALATAAQAIAQTISHAIAETLPANQRTSRVLVLFAGGGVRNAGLMRAMRRAIKASGSWKGSVRTTDEYGVPSDARETTAMALLGILAADGVSITLPAVTGRQAIRAIDGAFLLVP